MILARARRPLEERHRRGGVADLRLGTLVLLAATFVSPAVGMAPAALQGQASSGESAATPDRSAPSGASAAQDVRRVFNLLVAAANRLDAGAEGAFFWRSPELISVAQGTLTLGWDDRDVHTRQWYGALESQRIEPGQVEVRPLSPEVVALMTTMRQRIHAKDGRSWEDDGVWSLVFRRVKGEWKVVYEHYSYEK